jgi:hypothetical protein
MIRRALLVLPLATTLLCAAAPKPAGIPAYREGIEALSARLWEVAAARFQTALDTPDLDAAGRQEILLRLVETKVRAGEAAGALDLLDGEALAGHPEHTFWRAQALAAAGRYQEALAALDEASVSRGAPHFREALFTRAALLELLDDPAAALEALAALAKDPASSVRARLDSARLLLAMGKAEEALTSIPPPTARLSPPQAARADLLRAQAQLAKGEHQAAAGLFSSLLEKSGPAGEMFRFEASVGLARAQLAAGNREAATDGLIAFIEKERASPRVGLAFPPLLDCLPDAPAADDLILTRLAQWCPPAVIKSPAGIVPGEVAAGTWPAAPPVDDELATQALYHLAIGLRREGSPAAKEQSRRLLTRLRLEYPLHPLAEQALLQAARWDLADGRRDQAAAALAALDGSSSAPALRAEASLSAAATAFAAGDHALAVDELTKAAGLVDAEAADLMRLNAAVARLAGGDLPGFDALAARKDRPGRTDAELTLERALFLTSRRDPSAMARLDRFILDHPDHPRLPEARLAAATAALESDPPDAAFAKAQLDSLSPAQVETLPAVTLALARIRVAAREKRWADAATLAEAFIEARPDEPRLREVRFELGLARFENGDYNKARLDLEKLATEAPEDPLAAPALLLAARAAAQEGTPQAKTESLALFDRVILSKSPLADVARLLKSQALPAADAAAELLKWFDSMKRDHPLRLIAGLHLGDALYNSTEPGSQEKALGIYEKLLAELPAESSRRAEIEYYKGKVLEQLPDPAIPSKKREAEALAVYFSVLQDAAKHPPADWQWVDRCGLRARTLLENAQRWEAAIAVAKQHAALNSGTDLAKDAAERARELGQKHFIWGEEDE